MAGHVRGRQAARQEVGRRPRDRPDRHAAPSLVHGQGGVDEGVVSHPGRDRPLGRGHRGQQRLEGGVRSSAAGRGSLSLGHPAWPNSGRYCSFLRFYRMGAFGAVRHAQRISSSHFVLGAPDLPCP
eukprot:6117440-Pyramimonas_sp.AAC.1